ncbi:hypothetical protein FQN57_005981 [Myotisia sp. PD_48]|nr:hypothetical protein FQN57_005981 [Myotisia sp. PD_48]
MASSEVVSALSTIESASPQAKSELLTSLLSKITSSPDSPPPAQDLIAFFDAIINDNVGIVASRRLLDTFISTLCSLPPQVRVEVGQYAITTLETRSTSVEEQDALLRETLADAYEAEGEYLSAAKILQGIHLDSSQRLISDKAKIGMWIRIIRLYLEEDDTVNAETYVNKIKNLPSKIEDPELKLHFQLSQARVLDAKRRFLDASQEYLSVSLASGVDEEDRLHALSAAIRCAVLAPAGPQRARALSRLYSDDRASTLQEYGILEKIFRDQLLTPEEVANFASRLVPHQLAQTSDGLTVLDKAVIDHNLLAASRLYDNIGFDGLALILGLKERDDTTPGEQAVIYAARMLEQGRLKGTIDQIDGVINFYSGSSDVESSDTTGKSLRAWDAGVQRLAEDVENVAASIMNEFPVRTLPSSMSLMILNEEELGYVVFLHFPTSHELTFPHTTQMAEVAAVEESLPQQLQQQAEEDLLVPPRSAAGRALWNFSSQWFLVSQGTGIVAVILYRLDYQFNNLDTLAKIVWVYTIVLLVVPLFLYLLRLFLYPVHVRHQLRTNIIELSCLSSISIALTSIIQMICLALVHRWGATWGTIAMVLWWINTVFAVLAVLGIPYVYICVHPPGIKRMTPVVLLPLIAALTSAAGGAVVCRFGGLSNNLQFPIIVVSYLEIGLGLPLAVSLQTIYLFRLLDQHSFTSINEVYQTMILCGPFGQASFALQMLGQVVDQGTFVADNKGSFLSMDTKPYIAITSQFAGVLSWAYGTFWWVFAIISIIHWFYSPPFKGWRNTGFSMAAWSLVFPWGVYTNAAVMLGTIMDSAAFKVWSTVLLSLLVLIWATNQVLTIRGLITGKLLGLENGWKNAHDHSRPRRPQQPPPGYDDNHLSSEERAVGGWSSGIDGTSNDRDRRAK